jgi:hypothetical protein
MMSGQLKGVVFGLGDSQVTLGRDTWNEVCLEDDDLVSRRHCSLRDSRQDQFRNIVAVRADRSDAGYPNTDRLQLRLLELVMKVIPAKPGAILLVGRKPGEFVSGTYHDRSFLPSRLITHGVLHEGQPVLRGLEPPATL